MKVYFDQVAACNAVVLAAVIDKRFLRDHMTHETLHKKAYEFMLERIEHFMTDYHQHVSRSTDLGVCPACSSSKRVLRPIVIPFVHTGLHGRRERS